MDKEKQKIKLLTILNRNIPKNDRYTNNEIELAFSKGSYNSENKREKLIYDRLFEEYDNNEDLKELCAFYKITTTKIKKIYKSFSTERKINLGTFWSSRFRLPKVIGKILPRNDNKYLDMDKFENYELTPCISYEMAIRNDNVNKLLKKYEKIKEMMNDEQYSCKRFFTEHNFANAKDHPIQTFLKEYEGLTYREYEIVIMKKVRSYKKAIDRDYKEFIDKHINLCSELSISELIMLEKKIEDELINKYFIYPKGYNRAIPGASEVIAEEITNSQKSIDISVINDDSNKGPILERVNYKEFIQYQGLSTDNNYFVNNVIPNFKRQVNDQNKMIISINFSTPLDEIQEYLSLIHSKINSKSPLELLGKKLKRADNLSNITNENEKISLDITRGENPQQKLTDLLYIYDMKKIGFANTDIIYELDSYYPNKKTAMSENTINKYFSIAKEYIDKERYIELITGKIKNN